MDSLDCFDEHPCLEWHGYAERSIINGAVLKEPITADWDLQTRFSPFSCDIIAD